MNATEHVMKIECPLAHRNSSNPQWSFAQTNRFSGKLEVLVADPARTLAETGNATKQRAPQPGRTAEP